MFVIPKPALFAVTAMLALSPVRLFADVHSVQRQNAYEPAVLAVVRAIQSGELEQALQLADQHLTKFPKSRVGHLLRADILNAMATPISKIAQPLPADSQAVQGLKHQLQNRWRHVSASSEYAHDKFPASLIEMGRQAHVIVADMKEGRLYLYKNNDGLPELIRDYYLTVGSAGYGKQIEGDNKTPIGVYAIYQYIDDAELPDLYGEGAFPVDYPNKLDMFRKRTGYGIWLHGTPSNTYARSPWASEGCFVLSNDDFVDIEKYIDTKQRTPVILSDSIDWISSEQLQQRRQQFLQIVQRWKEDWESLHTDAYLSHYSQENFNFGQKNFASWADRKRLVNQGKTFVQIDMDIKSLFAYPGEKDMFVVKYRQRYLSNNYHGETDKEQYWQRDPSGQWKIIFEG